MLFAGWEVRIVKNWDRGLENAAEIIFFQAGTVTNPTIWLVLSAVGPYSEKLWPRAWKCCPRPAASGKKKLTWKKIVNEIQLKVFQLHVQQLFQHITFPRRTISKPIQNPTATVCSYLYKPVKTCHFFQIFTTHWYWNNNCLCRILDRLLFS